MKDRLLGAVEKHLELASLAGKDLPPSFQFSQGSLQDFVDCRRRFQLRYIWGLAWPAIESEPVMESERHMRQGALFHHMIHQHLSGVPAECLTGRVDDPELARWWRSYTSNLGGQDGLLQISGMERISGVFHEVALSAPIGAYRLLAKYDLILAGEDGRMLIVDWKTSLHLPRRQRLADRLQTRVYPYLLARAGATLIGGEINPSEIAMLYWYAEHPDQPYHFPYSVGSCKADGDYLKKLIATILRLGPDDFPLTEDPKRCAYCVYRSLCDRGVQAGSVDEIDRDQDNEVSLDLVIDFEQIAEIEF